MLYRIDDFELDTENFELRQSGVRRHVEPKVFDLLCYLSKNNGRVLTRDEIIEHVWQGRIVSDTTISSAIKSARKALGDSGANQNYIRTVRGRGFQFVADVEGSELAKEEKFAKSSHIVTAKISNQIGPSLIILPFQIFGDCVGMFWQQDHRMCRALWIKNHHCARILWCFQRNGHALSN